MVKNLSLFANAIAESLHEAKTAPTDAECSIRHLKRRGRLMSLPDEILSIIIEHAVLPVEPGLRALQLSHVCRRFHRATISLSKLWTCLSSTYHGNGLARLYAERSKHSGIDVAIHLDHPAECARLLQDAVPFCHEWRSFWSYGSLPSDAEEHRFPMNLPLLEHLRVQSRNDEAYQLYSMPNLKRADFIDIIPSPSFLSTITQFSMTFNTFNFAFADSNELVRLFDFLRATPSIKGWSLGIKQRIFAHDAMGLPVLTLKNIETFSLDILYYDMFSESEQSAYYLINNLRMPNLVHMNLCTRFAQRTSRTSRKDCLVVDLLPSPQFHPKFNSLNLTVVDRRGRFTYDDRGWTSFNADYNHMLVLDVERAPFLTCLKLTTNFEFYLLLEESVPFFPLRRLDLHGCPRLKNKFLADVYLGLKRDGNWERFEEAVVRGCPGIDTDTGFLSGLTEGKIRLEPVLQSEPDPLGFDRVKLWS